MGPCRWYAVQICGCIPFSVATLHHSIFCSITCGVVIGGGACFMSYSHESSASFQSHPIPYIPLPTPPPPPPLPPTNHQRHGSPDLMTAAMVTWRRQPGFYDNRHGTRPGLVMVEDQRLSSSGSACRRIIEQSIKPDTSWHNKNKKVT